MRHRFTIVVCCFFVLARVQAHEVLPSLAGLAVNNLWLFPDTSLSMATNETIRAGSVIEIVGRSRSEQLDKDQNQLFYWYKVTTAAGKTGWVFGDGLAVLRPVEQLPDYLRPLQRKPVSLGTGFEDATLWLAAIEGHDSKEYHGVFYGEYYLVVTNVAKRSIFLRYAGESAQGKTGLRQLFWQDLTGDGKPDLVLETSRKEIGEPLESRQLEIFVLQNFAWQKVFSEDLTLLDANGLPSPSLYKCADVEPKTIRIEYLDFLPCARYSLPYPTHAQTATRENCVEFVTYTYVWNPRASRFDLLYEPTRIAPTAAARNLGVSVRETPDLAGELVAVLSAEEKLCAIKLFDQITVDNGVKKAVPFWFVRTPDGQFGYVAAAKIQWLKTRHSKVMDAYGQGAPLLRSDWHFEFPFVRLLMPEGAIGRF